MAIGSLAKWAPSLVALTLLPVAYWAGIEAEKQAHRSTPFMGFYLQALDQFCGPQVLPQCQHLEGSCEALPRPIKEPVQP